MDVPNILTIPFIPIVPMVSSFRRSGFTLIELLMVIAIIALISTLAVNRFGGITDKASRKVSVANQQAIGRAVDTYLALNPSKLNRLDALVDAGTSTSGTAGYSFSADHLYNGPDGATAEQAEKNSGLDPALLGVLCTYRVNANEAAALQRLGLAYVMQHNTHATGYPSQHYTNDDGSIPQAIDGLDPELSACVTRAVTNGMVFAAVNPMKDLGRTIFQSCGQTLLNNKNWGQAYDETTVRGEVEQTGGPLLAFGLGANASIVGAAQGGLEAAPFSEVIPAKYYRQYILLFRLRKAGSGSVSSVTAEFAGVLDPQGNSIRAARHALKE